MTTTVTTTLPPVVAAPAPQAATTPLLQLRDATREPVESIDLAILPREIVGVVSEVNADKSTLARMASGLLALSSGERRWRADDVTDLHGSAARAMRLRVQMLFDDPDGALNPRMRVMDIVGEAPLVHRIIRRRQQVEYVGLQLNRVGIDPMLMRRFPHQFTPGQRTRIGIARALAVQPELLVCDEPIAALDVSVQAQLLNLLMDLRSALELTCLFVSRDVSVVAHICDRVMVLHRGRIVESAPTRELLATPAHPYTRTLLATRRSAEPAKRAIMPVQGDAGSVRATGCRFLARCPHAMDACREAVPPLLPIAPEHAVACHLHRDA